MVLFVEAAFFLAGLADLLLLLFLAGLPDLLLLLFLSGVFLEALLFLCLFILKHNYKSSWVVCYYCNSLKFFLIMFKLFYRHFFRAFNFNWVTFLGYLGSILSAATSKQTCYSKSADSNERILFILFSVILKIFPPWTSK